MPQETKTLLFDGTLMNKKMTQIIYCTLSKSGDYTIPNTVTTICTNTLRLLRSDFDRDPETGD